MLFLRLIATFVYRLARYLSRLKYVWLLFWLLLIPEWFIFPVLVHLAEVHDRTPPGQEGFPMPWMLFIIFDMAFFITTLTMPVLLLFADPKPLKPGPA